jgi:peptidoglycan/xylan/chitin deacetylase (PgdA/CDA1 family)
MIGEAFGQIMRIRKLITAIWVASVFVLHVGIAVAGVHGNATDGVPILLYHRFAAVSTNEMTVRVTTFESQLRYLQDHRYKVIPLQQLVAYRLGKSGPPPARSVVITMDDGHESVYRQAFPLLKRFRVPVTLFIYPSAISNASYALTWSQLREMEETGLIEIQSHTYWHPNFKREKRRLNARQYDAFVDFQLRRSKAVLEAHLGITVTMLAWPFGIYDEDLIRKAKAAGYLAAFTIVRRPASVSDNIMALPRCIVVDNDKGERFGRLLGERQIIREGGHASH